MSLGNSGRPIAVITGASSGLGKCYAFQLAKKGCDLLLVARQTSKLQQTQVEIQQKYDVEIELLSADLSDLSDIQALEKRIEKLTNLRYLINNAGFGANQKFPDVFIDVETQMIITHCLAPMRLCRAAAAVMKSQKENGRAGYIVNVASIAGFLAGEGAADYAGTKSYLISFSKSLQCDVKRYGIRVQALCPGYIRTGFHDAPTMRFSNLKQTVPNFLWQKSERVVAYSLRALHSKWNPNVVCIPTVVYKLAGFFGSSWLFSPLRVLLSGGSIR